MTPTLCRNCGRAIQLCRNYGTSNKTWWIHLDDNMLVCVDNERSAHLTVANPVVEKKAS